MISKSWNFKRFAVHCGTSHLWGIELTYDVNIDAVNIKLFNLWLCVEWW